MFVVELLFRVKRIMQDCEDELAAFLSWEDPKRTGNVALTNAQQFPQLADAILAGATLSWEEVLVTWSGEDLQQLLAAMNRWRRLAVRKHARRQVQ